MRLKPLAAAGAALPDLFPAVPAAARERMLLNPEFPIHLQFPIP